MNGMTAGQPAPGRRPSLLSEGELSLLLLEKDLKHTVFS